MFSLGCKPFLSYQDYNGKIKCIIICDTKHWSGDREIAGKNKNVIIKKINTNHNICSMILQEN